MRVRHLFTAVMTVLAVSPAYALGSHQIGVQAGLSVPTGDFSDAANAGYNVGAEYRYVLDRFGVGAEAKYNAWNGSKDVNAAAEALYGSGSKYSFSAWQTDVFGIVSMPMAGVPKVLPYLRAGLGVYGPGTKLEIPGTSTTESNSEFGMLFGAGFDFSMSSSMKLGVGATYHRVKDSEADFFSTEVRMLFPIKAGHD